MPAELALEIDVQSLATMQQQGDDFLLIDVRGTDERDLASIDRSTHIPMTELEQRIGELEPYRERRIVVHCHHGGRSLKVTEALRAAGFAKIQSLAGGIDQWSEQIDPTVPRY